MRKFNWYEEHTVKPVTKEVREAIQFSQMKAQVEPLLAAYIEAYNGPKEEAAFAIEIAKIVECDTRGFWSPPSKELEEFLSTKKNARRYVNGTLRALGSDVRAAVWPLPEPPEDSQYIKITIEG